VTDVNLVVVGGGVMGAWTAFLANRAGYATTLLEAYGIGHPRATSGDETRTIRSAHGPDAFYARWARAAREDWQRFGEEWGEPLFLQSGALWFALRDDGFEASSEPVLRSLGIPFEHLSPGEMAARWPQVAPEGLSYALFEPEAGVIRARRSVEAVVAAFMREGGTVEIAVARPGGREGDRMRDVVLADGRRLGADAFVFASGPWLPRLFPEVLESTIRVTKQDLVFFGPTGGDARFRPASMPAWIEYDAAIYGIPSVDDRGFKVGPDRSGPLFDPSVGERIVDPETVRLARAYLRRRFPALSAAPVVETRVCQYESTLDTHFVIDRHPGLANAWLVGGGSGHGFKHGPQIGRYLVERLGGAGPAPDEERFSLAQPRRAGLGMRSAGDHATTDGSTY
jgi:glycine/D-amino acid oxidase-like deaminating enzyme